MVVVVVIVVVMVVVVVVVSVGLQGEGHLPPQVPWCVQESAKGCRRQQQSQTQLGTKEQELEQTLHGRQHCGQAETC